jgi:hypothetical protein
LATSDVSESASTIAPIVTVDAVLEVVAVMLESTFVPVIAPVAIAAVSDVEPVAVKVVVVSLSRTNAIMSLRVAEPVVISRVTASEIVGVVVVLPDNFKPCRWSNC